MHIGVIGAGYVGLVTGACLADTGNKVTLVDVDREKVDSINRGVPPIHEEGLEELLRRNQHRITASTSYHDLDEAQIFFICVGTPSAPDGSINLRYVEEAAGTIAGRLGDNWKLIVVKSTVIPGTTEEMVRPKLEKTGNRAGADFGLAMNPEFLREGKAVSDFQRPDRIVIGVTDQRSEQLLRHLYAPYQAPLLVTTPTAAEMIKYASNALLATKISYANEIGNYCKQLGVDVYDVMAGVGMDHRISPHFLNAGAGFGGSCFPKDVRALISAGTEAGLSMGLLRAVMEVNQRQPLRMLD
ncbi:MAG: UDP-glucose dehydrogenase family protein, partial [Thermoplasmatota archaeon]